MTVALDAPTVMVWAGTMEVPLTYAVTVQVDVEVEAGSVTLSQIVFGWTVLQVSYVVWVSVVGLHCGM